MKKEEFIERRGEAAYKKMIQQNSDWNALHREEISIQEAGWRAANPAKVKANHQKHTCKGGKYHERHLEYEHTGLRGERNRIRKRHGKQYRPFKNIIAPESQIHHEWVPGTAEYRGVALVEADQHMHGYIDVIKILDGKITLLTEQKGSKEVKNKT